MYQNSWWVRVHSPDVVPPKGSLEDYHVHDLFYLSIPNPCTAWLRNLRTKNKKEIKKIREHYTHVLQMDALSKICARCPHQLWQSRQSSHIFSSCLHPSFWINEEKRELSFNKDKQDLFLCTTSYKHINKSAIREEINGQALFL